MILLSRAKPPIIADKFAFYGFSQLLLWKNQILSVNLYENEFKPARFA